VPAVLKNAICVIANGEEIARVCVGGIAGARLLQMSHALETASHVLMVRIETYRTSFSRSTGNRQYQPSCFEPCEPSRVLCVSLTSASLRNSPERRRRQRSLE
jgi:hypothetical protein